MKLSEMFEAFTHEDAKTLNDVKISRYMPIATKVDLINSCDKKFAAAELDISNTTAIAKMKELAKFFDLLLAYVDIEVDDRSEEMYDRCMAANFDLFVKHYVKNDYERLCRMFDEEFDMGDSAMLRKVLLDVGTTDMAKDLEASMKILGENQDVIKNLNYIIGYNEGAVR